MPDKQLSQATADLRFNRACAIRLAVVSKASKLPQKFGASMDSLFLGLMTLILSQGVINNRDNLMARTIAAAFFWGSAALFVWSLT